VFSVKAGHLVPNYVRDLRGVIEREAAEIVEAVKRFGRHVVVGFFAAHGLSPELRIAADDFVDLTEHFKTSWQGWQRHIERLNAPPKT